MRVIGGCAKGRKLKAVPGESTRPILDRVKTPLFDVLRPKLAGAVVLDLFAGSGSVGIEALSQGAAKCIFLDTAKAAIETIRDNLEIVDLVKAAEVRHTDAFSYLRSTSKSFDLIYVAPPQYKNLWVEALQTIAERPQILRAGGTVVAQIDPKEYEILQLKELSESDR
ncbi:MAG: 16S rRNA (guanine(966)-N(2))-methyltransferase RsmD, partial [Bdellovibrionales bacterium]|nr:16S rRNA (guanine(966)-N(2))-methyltransferase RsmD [Bdellovibrionales bacterium]